MYNQKQIDEINYHLISAWKKFLRLEKTHNDHERYFRDGIHSCQQVLMWKELQQLKPKKYPSYKK